MAEILRTRIFSSSIQAQAFSAWPMLARTQMAASSSCVPQPAPGWMESMVSGMPESWNPRNCQCPVHGSLLFLHCKQTGRQVYNDTQLILCMVASSWLNSSIMSSIGG